MDEIEAHEEVVDCFNQILNSYNEGSYYTRVLILEGCISIIEEAVIDNEALKLLNEFKEVLCKE